MTMPGPGSARPTVPAPAKTPWYVWVLVSIATMAAGPVAGGGYAHAVLLFGAGVVFIAGSVTFAFLQRLSPRTVWACVVLVFLACGIAVLDVSVTGTVLLVPIGSLGFTAVLALTAAIASLLRLGRTSALG